MVNICTIKDILKKIICTCLYKYNIIHMYNMQTKNSTIPQTDNYNI